MCIASFCNPVVDLLVYCVVSSRDAAQVLDLSELFQLNATNGNVQVAGMHLSSHMTGMQHPWP